MPLPGNSQCLNTGTQQKTHPFMSLLKSDLQRLGFGVERAIATQEWKKTEKKIMGSTTLTLHPATVLPKTLVPIACSDRSVPATEQVEAELHPVRMEWIVINDANGNRRLQMHWWAK
jgi:hypothetical protein